jgi:uncharacterized membrane protein
MMRGFGYYGGMGGGAWLFVLFGVLLKVLIVVAIVVIVLMVLRRSRMHGHGPMMHGDPNGEMPAGTPGIAPPAPGHDEAVAIVRRRLASGEITKEQFDELMKSLG